MHQKFKHDLWSLARENKGYYAWAREARRGLNRLMHHRLTKRRYPWHYEGDSVSLVHSIFDDGLGMHPLLDIAFEAFTRAEARLGYRFIPQRSHEERLTGHLISELEAAIQIASDEFSTVAAERYSESLCIDFAYSDLSRGGKIEKETGGDFGIILVIDLPDRPKVIRYAAIQAKRIDRRASLEKIQFDNLTRNFEDSAFYLFYDCNFSTLVPPMMVPHGELNHRREAKDETKSFSVDQEFVFATGVPLSLWLLTELGAGNAGGTERDFQTACRKFTQAARADNGHTFSRLAMISIGRSFGVTPDIEAGLRIDL